MSRRAGLLPLVLLCSCFAHAASKTNAKIAKRRTHGIIPCVVGWAAGPPSCGRLARRISAGVSAGQRPA
jgi:hypothetical protein